MRIQFLPREKAAVIKLRRFGYSTSQLAKFFGRSTSVIHRILKRNHRLGAITLRNLRWLPDRVKKIASARVRREQPFYLRLWMPFILGEADRPP